MADPGDEERERTCWPVSAQPSGRHNRHDDDDEGKSSEQLPCGLPPRATAGGATRRSQTSKTQDPAPVGSLPAGAAPPLGFPPLRRSSRARKAPAMFNAVVMEIRGRVPVPPESRRPRRTSQAARVATDTDTPDNRRAQRKPGRLCKTDGCDNYIVYNGLCCRHGGGKRCSVNGCEASAKHKGLCWRHGGSTECKVDGCVKKAKAKGVCWSHGGGTRCRHANCTKISVTKGLCWAHGGGKRCIHDGCQRPAYVRTHSFCEKHYTELQHVDYYEV